MNIILKLLTILFFVFNSSHAQEVLTINDSVTGKIESYILYNKKDSLSSLFELQKTSPYLQSLKRIYTKDKPTYSDYYAFVSNLGNHPEVNYTDVSNYINKHILQPKNKQSIDLDYVNIKWLQVSKLRDEASIGEASVEQEKLENYINRFNPTDVNTIKAQLLSSTHQIVLYQIQNDIQNGKALCLENLKKADELGDIKLRIIFLYHLCDFLILERKLEEYIEASEQSLELEKELPTHTSYYIGTIIHLLDAYIFKGGHEKRVEELLNLLFLNPETKAQSYSLYAKYISTLNSDSPKLQSIFKQFEVSNILEFCTKIETLGENVLNANDFFHVLNESSKALAAHGFFDEALRYKDKSVVLTRKIYSEDLSQSLSSFKTKQALKEKEIEIERVKERSKLYIIIASLVAGLLLITYIFFIRKKKQSKLLKAKNDQINLALKEKELLVKEVHHRVKNNFQIIASLLDLQAKGIEDETAKVFANESKNRLKSMALIHQKLYQDENGLINFGEYIHLLVNEVSSIYNYKKNIDIHILANNLFFDIDTAIPLGLIINELLTNAYKYAFLNNTKGSLKVTVAGAEQGSYKLTVADNGSGIPNNFDIKKTKSFGFNLVNRLVKQLRGTMVLTNSNGAIIEIEFQDKKARKIID